MKALIFIFLSIASVFSSSFLAKRELSELGSKQEFIDFTIGFLVALKFVEKVPDGFNCVNDLSSIQNKTQQAINLIRTKDPNNIAQGLAILQQTLNQTFHSCGATISEGNAYFQVLVKEISDPFFIFKALARFKSNYATILADLNKGIQDLKQHNFFNSGIDFGNALNILINGNQQALVDFMVNEISLLGSMNWPFTNCGAASDSLQVSTVTLDAAPTKGTNDGISFQGTANAPFTLKQVTIQTSVNGNVLNKQSDPNTNSYNPGDPFNYHFSVFIPGFAPSGNYAVSFTFENNDGSIAGCSNLSFNL